MKNHIIQRVPEFKDVERSRTAYERAVNALDLLPGFTDAYRGMLIGKLGLKDPYKAPEGGVRKDVRFSSLEFELEGHRVINPSYKGIVEGWEQQINGINFLSQARNVEGFPREAGKVYAHAGRLLEDFLVSVYGNLKPGIEVNVRVNDESGLYVAEIELPGELTRESLRFDEQGVRTYLNAVQMMKGFEAFVKAYKKGLSEEAKESGEARVSVTKKAAYKLAEVVSSRINWGNVVKTLVTMPTEHVEDGERELEVLADETLSTRERMEELGEFYELRSKRDGLFVGIDSVMARMEDLKHPSKKVKTTTARRRENLQALKSA